MFVEEAQEDREGRCRYQAAAEAAQAEGQANRHRATAGTSRREREVRCEVPAQSEEAIR